MTSMRILAQQYLWAVFALGAVFGIAVSVTSDRVTPLHKLAMASGLTSERGAVCSPSAQTGGSDYYLSCAGFLE